MSETREASLYIIQSSPKYIDEKCMKLNCFRTPLDFPSFHLCADCVSQALKRAFLTNVGEEDKCSVAKRRGRNNIMKVVSDTKAQAGHTVALSSPPHLTRLHKFQIPPRLSRDPSRERADKTAAG